MLFRSITASRKLTTQMKATGEVMSICTNFEGALMKAIRSLEQHVDSLINDDYSSCSDDDILELLKNVDDKRMYVIAEALRRGIDYDTIHSITMIDEWFIDKFNNIVKMEKRLATEPLTKELLLEAKRIEFPDVVIGRLAGKKERDRKSTRLNSSHMPKSRMPSSA